MEIEPGCRAPSAQVAWARYQLGPSPHSPPGSPTACGDKQGTGKGGTGSAQAPQPTCNSGRALCGLRVRPAGQQRPGTPR